MEFCNNHPKILKTSATEADKDILSIFGNKFIKETSVETNDSLKDQSLKISIDRNNNKHVLSPLGHSQGPRGIKVSRLSLQCSESSIRHSLIQQFGIQNKTSQNRSSNIRSIVLESAAGPSPTRWAIVTFIASYDAEKALQMATKSQSVELHPGYDLFDFDELNLTTNCPQGLDEFHPKASRTLQISNLPQTLNNFKTLYEYFSKLGKVLDIEIKPKLVLHASALVQFSDISKVVKILVSPRAVLKCLVGSSITSSTSFQFGPSFPTNCIWLGQISNSINENQITEYFSRFGHVLEVVQDVKQQKALVYLDNAFAAQQSIIHLKRKNSFLGTCRVQVDYASLECQATISYWLSNNFPTLPVPPDIITLKPSQQDNNSYTNNVICNRSISRLNSNQEKLVLNINKSITNEPNSQLHSNSIQKSSDLQTSLNLLSNLEPLNYSQPTISIKNYQNSIGNSGLNISEMVVTERIQTDNATRVTPICNKRTNNIRITNPYDSNCDTTSNNRFSQNYDPPININSAHMSQTSIDYQNQTLTNIKKERNYTENSNESKIVNNIRISCNPVTWLTNTCTSQSSDISKTDVCNRQFSPWSAPVRNRVVARVDPFSHTSSNNHNSSQANLNILSKTIQSSAFLSRNSNSIASHNINRNVQRPLSSVVEKELNTTIKQENFISLNKNLIHSNEREYGSIKRRTNYNQPLTYRVAKNTDIIPKPFDNRTSLFSGIPKLKSSKNLNYKVTDISELSNKQVTAAELFGEDFSDLSDSDSASSYICNSRKRKQKLSKCKSPSVDSSSTMSVLSSEKQNRFIRVSKIHYHTNKKSMHLKPSKRSKNRLKPNKCSSGNVSSDEACSEIHNTNLNRQKMKISIKDKTDTTSSSMKPLTVNVSLSNFEDNHMDSDDISSQCTDNSSLKISKKCLNICKKQAPIPNSKRKQTEKSGGYRNINLSSSSDNEPKDFKRKYKLNSNRKSKSFLNEYEERKRSNSYVIERRYKENKFISKNLENRTHKTKLESDHYSKNKMIYGPTHSFLSNKCLNEKDEEKSSYISRNRQHSDSPPIKRKKLRHEEIIKANSYRMSDKQLNDSSFGMDLHTAFKRHEYQHLSQEISSDAVFQKEFDEFKRDQASDQSSVHRKGNSSKVSSASSVGIKTFSSYEKYKSQKQTKSSKINNVYTTSPDCKNIFQIDMNNINMYESMYDKVKRRAQKQAETKVSRNSPEVNEQLIKRKSKGSEHKHKSLKEKMYYKRHKKPRDVIRSPTSTVYSDESSILVDDSQSNYSSTMYVASEKDSVLRNKNIHNQKMYKSTKNSTVSSFESPNSFTATSRKRSKNKDEILRIYKYSSNKISENKYFTSKKLENEYENDEEHENVSEFSYKTNTSVVNFSNKPVKEYFKTEMEEVANISDATASTEPMEYAEVDLESLKMSDDDWKSGLSSQSSSESGNNMAKIELHNVEVVMEKSVSLSNEKPILSEKVQLSNFVTDNEVDSKMVSTKRDVEINEKTESIEVESVSHSPCKLENDNKTTESKDTERIFIEVDNHECVKEEQDIAIASIMLKEENDSKSPIDWKSNLPNNIANDSHSSINNIFDSSCHNEDILSTCNNFEEIALTTNILKNNIELINTEFTECLKSEVENIKSKNVSFVNESTNINTTEIENAFKVDKLISNNCEDVISMKPTENCDSLSVDLVNVNDTNKVTESKSVMDQTTSSNHETQQVENSSNISVSNSRNNAKSQFQQNKTNNTSNEKIDLTSYVKGVIEQVKREQSAENQNKLKLEKSANKRIKKLSNSTISSKNSQSSNNSTSSNFSMSLLAPLQKSPAVSMQASVIDNTDCQVSVTSHSSHALTPNIPGVNVCSPVTSVHLSICKPSVETTVISLPDTTINKTIPARSNFISITSLTAGTALQTDQVHTNSLMSELKVNTELNLCPTTNELHASVSDSLSTQVSNSSIKSPLSEDHTKQRICTRLRRADPSKADSNYKIVTTTCVTRSDINVSNNNNNNNITNSKLNEIENSNPILMPNKSSKQTDNIVGPDNVISFSDKIADPYEPNFDESPLEFSRYRTKTKNTFFPNDNKNSKLVPSTEEVRSGTPVSAVNNTKSISVNVISNFGITSTSSIGSLGIDSVSQIIEEVVHGNFNYTEYLNSFKNGKISSFQISPSTTPLTFVSNDSRDCSSVSADNLSNANMDTTASTSMRKSNSSQKSVITTIAASIDESRKLDILSSVSTSSSSNNKPTVTLITSISAKDINLCKLYAAKNKISPLKDVANTNTQNMSISPVFNSEQSQFNSDLLTFINLCKSKDGNSLKSNTNISQDLTSKQTLPISSIQLQSCNNNEVSAVLPITCTSPFEKDSSSNNKLSLNLDQALLQNISKNDLINITVNSTQSQKIINPLFSSSVHNQEENNAFKAYLNIFQRSNFSGLNLDPSTLSKLQCVISDSSMKNINSLSDSNSYRNSNNINQLDSLQIQSIKDTNIDIVNSNILGNSQNISSRTIADMIIPRMYPLVWEGKLSLKNEEAKVALHFVHGNTELLNACMHLLIFSGSLQWNNTGSLKIVQRMRLDLSQLEGVQRRMQNSNEYCIGLALPGGDDINQWMKQSRILQEGFIKYMRDKGAAGIINVCHPENNQQGLYVVHIFPPCEFSTNQLLSTAPDLQNIIEMNNFPNLLVVITTV